MADKIYTITCMYICIYVFLFGYNDIVTITKVNLQDQYTNFSGQIQAYLCEPGFGCNKQKILARVDLEWNCNNTTKLLLIITETMDIGNYRPQQLHTRRISILNKLT